MSIKSSREVRKLAAEIDDMLEALEDDVVIEEGIDEEIVDDSLEDMDDEVEDDDDDILGEELLDELDDDEDEEVEEEFSEASITSSELEPGIEDEISDTATGGDPTVQDETPAGQEAKNEVQEDSEVFPTTSEYVASELDKVATVLEEVGMTKIAYRLDVLADSLESK